MIKRIDISNYRSIGDRVSVGFNDFTVLVGPNGSGKSNVVDALRFVKDSMEMGLSGAITHRHGIAAVRRWSGGHPFDVEIEVHLQLDGRPALYSFSLTGASREEYRVRHEEALVSTADESFRFRTEFGAWRQGPTGLSPRVDDTSLTLPTVAGDTRFKPLFQALQRMAIYAIYPDTLSKPQKYSPQKPMSLHGANWVSILRDQPADTWKPELIEALRRLTGDIEDLRVEQAASYLVAQFRHRTEKRLHKWFDAAQESDGTLRFAGILTALLQEPPLPLIGIEEPELTVHPGAIPLLFDYLKQACRQSQLIVTSHSPELLELVDADNVRVVQRANGVTTVAPMDENQREVVRDGLLTLGDLMVSEGLQQQLPLDRDE